MLKTVERNMKKGKFSPQMLLRCMGA